MSEFSKTDCELMARALRLARRGLFTAHPNPRVGCVLVRDGEIVGEGWHARTGEAHAEINAIEDAGERARGATAYVTLEPCSHHGKTPPCANALIDAGITEVVIGMRDPSSRHGIDLLQRAGISLRTGLMQSEAERLNEGFLSRVVRKRAFVRLKLAASLDGATAMADGQSQWITGQAARADVQRLRASSGAILTGIGTVQADDPALTVRGDLVESQPLRVILDSHFRMPSTAKMLDLPGQTVIFCIDEHNREPLAQERVTLYKVPAVDGRVDVNAVLSKLAALEINDVLVEAGPVLAGAMLEAGVVDELVIYQAPHIMGSNTRGMFATPSWQDLDQRLALEVTDLRRIGADIRITARPSSRKDQ